MISSSVNTGPNLLLDSWCILYAMKSVVMGYFIVFRWKHTFFFISIHFRSVFREINRLKLCKYISGRKNFQFLFRLNNLIFPLFRNNGENFFISSQIGGKRFNQKFLMSRDKCHYKNFSRQNFGFLISLSNNPYRISALKLKTELKKMIFNNFCGC